MKTNTSQYGLIVLTWLMLAALACNGLSGGAPTETPPIPDILEVPTDEDILGLGDDPAVTLEPGQPLDGDCLEEINPGSDIVLPVTQGVIEIQAEQFISVGGEVSNPTDQWVVGVLVWVRMCDETGTQLLHRESFYTLPSQIPPGGSVAFQLLRDVANTEGKVIPSQYRIDAVAIYGDDSLQGELVNFTATANGDQIDVTGSFKNTGTEPCLSPTIVVAFYKDGLVYEVHYLLAAEISEIAPGDESEIDDYYFTPEGVTDTKFFAACE
jgi:hypothetical protein